MMSKRLVGLHHRVRYTCGAFTKVHVNSLATKPVAQLHHRLLEYPSSFCVIRYASTNTVVPPVITKAIEAASPSVDDISRSSSNESLVESIGPIPEAPGLPGPKVLELLSNGEPSLTSLGLGGYWPSGILQQLLEFVHVTGNLSWGVTIVLVATSIRVLCFKLVVRQRQESSKFAAVMPQLQYLQQKMLEARQQNDLIQASRYALELSEFQKQNPSMLGPLKYGLIQAVILLSFTQALRQMCSLPVQSLQSGGFFSIVDLTMSDPTLILPAVNGILLYLHLATGKEIHTMFPTKNPLIIQGGMIGVSALLFVVSMNFQGAIVLYWISSQCVTVLQYHILSQPKVKEYYGLDIKANPKVSAMMKQDTLKKKSETSKLGFLARMREAQANSRLADEVKRRTEIDSAAFERAGREPIRKTYKYDITKVKNPK